MSGHAHDRSLAIIPQHIRGHKHGQFPRKMRAVIDETQRVRRPNVPKLVTRLGVRRQRLSLLDERTQSLILLRGLSDNRMVQSQGQILDAVQRIRAGREDTKLGVGSANGHRELNLGPVRPA